MLNLKEIKLKLPLLNPIENIFDKIMNVSV